MFDLTLTFRLVGWSLTVLLTQFTSYRAFKVDYIVNIQDLIEINSWSKANKKRRRKIYIYIYTYACIVALELDE